MIKSIGKVIVLTWFMTTGFWFIGIARKIDQKQTDEMLMGIMEVYKRKARKNG